MIGSFRNIIKNFLISSSAAIFLRFINSLIVLAVIKKIPVVHYGIWHLYNSFMSILTNCMNFGLRQSLIMQYYQVDQDGQKRLINNIIITYVLVSLPLYALLLIQNSLISRFIFKDFLPNPLIYICIISSIFYLFNDFFIQILRYHSAVKIVTKAQIITTFITIVATVILVLKLNFGLIGLAISHFLGLGILFALALYAYLKNKYQSFLIKDSPASTAISSLKEGIPFFPASLSPWLLSSSSRWILAYYASFEDVGIYALVDAVSHFFDIVILQSLQGSYIPHVFDLFSQHKENPEKIEWYNKKIMLLVVALANITLILSYLFLTDLFYQLLPIAYHKAIPYIWVTLASSILLMATQFASVYLQFLKFKKFLAIASFMPTIVNLIINILLIPKYKIDGCVIANFISTALYFSTILTYNFYIVKSKQEPSKHTITHTA